jgi:hypothetical protein
VLLRTRARQHYLCTVHENAGFFLTYTDGRCIHVLDLPASPHCLASHADPNTRCCRTWTILRNPALVEAPTLLC